MSRDKRPDTRLVEAGRRKEWLRGMVNVPVSRTSTVLFDSVADANAAYPPEDGRLTYGRNGTWTFFSVEVLLYVFVSGGVGYLFLS